MEYQVIIQVETAVTARSRREAEERAEQIADALKTPAPPGRRPRWWPDEVEVTATSVQE